MKFFWSEYHSTKIYKLYSMLFVMAGYCMFPSQVFAVQSEAAISDGCVNMAFVYAILAVVSLLMVAGYGIAVQKKDIWMLLLFVSVFIVNTGYFALAVSTTLEEALLANRIAYLGSVFLPFFMFMTIITVCRISLPKWFVAILLSGSVAVFIIAASPGYLDCYYKEVTLVFVNEMAKLHKVYGALHKVYYIYLFGYFVLMLGTVWISVYRQKVVSHKHVAMLLVVVFLNIAIWFIEQFIYCEFEFLSISYIVSELLLLLLYGMMQDYGIFPGHSAESICTSQTETEISTADIRVELPEAVSPMDDKEDNDCVSEVDTMMKKLQEICPAVHTLSSREKDVLCEMLKDKKRKEIADTLYISENTVKTHTANIYAKLGVTSKSELFYKLAQKQ